MRILIEPNDVLMFRESKPYTAGESHLARSVYPLPQTIAGALRTAILIRNDFSNDAKELAGYRKEEPEFDVLGHFLFREKEFFHTPLDVAESKDIDGYFLVEPLFLNQWNRFIFKGKTIHFESVGGFIDYDRLVGYLKGEIGEEELEEVVSHDLTVRESRVGIKLGNAKTTEESFFYKAEFLRLAEGVKISIWLGEKGDKVKELLKDEKGLLSLGGESRFVRFEIRNERPLSRLENVWDEIREEINRKKRLKLYAATPLLIKDGGGCFGWDINWVTKNEHGGIKIKRIYPLIGKPVTFSGWDYASNRPKPNRYAIPSGSVYFVELKGEIECDRPYLKLGELTKLGFGLCFMGVW
ncbi:type III-B CRISPR module-associated protein Cmr3 [Archaeoglobus sp.]